VLSSVIPTLDSEKTYGVTGHKDDIDYAIENFKPLKSFYEACVKNNQSIIIEIS